MFNDPGLKNESTAWLNIIGFDMNPDEITKEVGVNPTKTRIKGEYRTVGTKTPRKIINKENQWILESSLSRKLPLEKHLEHLLDKIKFHKDSFKYLTKSCTVELNSALYYYEANPGLSFETELLKEIADFDISLNLDIYCLAGTVLELEQPKVVRHLKKHLSEVKFLLNGTKENEVNYILESLKGIEESAYAIQSDYMHDLIWTEKLEDERYEETLLKIAKEINNINNYVKKSKYLSSLVNK